MKLKREQLSGHLDKTLLNIYLITGDEPLLVEECCDLICAKAKALGYDERLIRYIDSANDWQQLEDVGQQGSLFSQKQLIDCRVSGSKFGDKGSKALAAYVERLPEDIVLMLRCGKLDARQLRAKWCQSIERVGGIVQIWSLNLNDFSRWIHGLLKRKQLDISADALRILVGQTEGHLLAAKQAVDLLSVHCAPGTVCDEASIKNLVDNHARFQMFQAVDSALAGDLERTRFVLRRLLSEGVDVTLILWALCQDVRLLIKLLWARSTGENLQSVYRKFGVWDSKQRVLGPLVNYVDRQSLYLVLEQARVCDACLKGAASGDVHTELMKLGEMLAQICRR